MMSKTIALIGFVCGLAICCAIISATVISHFIPGDGATILSFLVGGTIGFGAGTWILEILE